MKKLVSNVLIVVIQNADKMIKEEIIDIASKLGFKLDYDQFNIEDKQWLRFVSKDNSLDEKDLRWIWYKEDSNEDNIKRGKYIQSRLKRKAEVQEFLKY